MAGTLSFALRIAEPPDKTHQAVVTVVLRKRELVSRRLQRNSSLYAGLALSSRYA